jgi:hypothetical protein
VAAIGMVALAGALALPATASAAVTSHAGGASPQLYHDFFILNNSNGKGIFGLNGNVYLGSAAKMENIDEDTVDGHVYYEYEDLTTGNCLQANVGDSFMTEGICAGVSRQFWFWNSKVITNLAFGSKAYAAGDVALGFGSGDAYAWTIAGT